MDEIKHFLQDVLSIEPNEKLSDVRVTLTFAQSVNAKIAGPGGQQLLLSCKESMIMTHRLRSMHDAILVGINTALNDNPQLNTRLLPKDDGGDQAPIPVILDKDLRFRSDSKLLNNYNNHAGRQPVIFTRASNDEGWLKRREILEGRGALVVTIGLKDGLLCMQSLLRSLKGLGVRSLMVEGGARVISSFLRSGLVNRLIVTVAPLLVSEEGIGYNLPEDKIAKLTFWQSKAIGRDTVMIWKCDSGL